MYAIKDSLADGNGGWIYFTTWTEFQGIEVTPGNDGYTPGAPYYPSQFLGQTGGPDFSGGGAADGFDLAGGSGGGGQGSHNLVSLTMGVTLSGMEAMNYSDVLKIWSANNKFYGFNFKGNQHTRSITQAKSTAAVFKYAGWAWGFYNFYSTNNAYTNGEISEREMYFDQGANVISTALPFPYGPAFSIFYELGKGNAAAPHYSEPFNPYGAVEEAILNKPTK